MMTSSAAPSFSSPSADFASAAAGGGGEVTGGPGAIEEGNGKPEPKPKLDSKLRVELGTGGVMGRGFSFFLFVLGVEVSMLEGNEGGR
jgi:hypothetical protein